MRATQKITLPPWLTVQTPGPRPGIIITAIVSLDAHTGRYEPQSVTVENPLEPITPADMRVLAIRRRIAEALRPVLLEANPQLHGIPAVKAWGGASKGRKPAAASIENPRPQDLGAAALVMALETAAGGFTIRAVERACRVDYDVARRWAARVRRGEYL